MTTAGATTNRVIAVVIALLGAAFVIAGSRLEGPELIGDPGASLLPRIVGALLVILGAALFLRPAPRTALPDEPHTKNRPWSVVLLVVAAAIAYAALFGIAGFTIASVMFVFAVPLIMGGVSVRSVVLAAAVAILFTVVVGYSLYTLLGIPLPGVLVG